MPCKEDMEEKKMFKKYGEYIFLANMLMIIAATYLTITGLFFITAPADSNSPTYGRMLELMSFDAYGLFMLVAATLLFVSSFQTGKLRHLSMLVGGILGALILGLYASASTQGAVNLMIPLRYSLIACTNLIIAAVGGIGLWRSRRLGSSQD
ncbi:hypothetical protein J14TS2_15930 [Bacillus sp. J14TS2]|uniref:hypothetical protein n=1 Tax=Bacillus sp. J14TS2 TaxID=2807188 RepID=UPI001B071FDA|nr:hypothetical protein [Bacillus sp. J14TS2]GIN71118.1 hypothetical protein J14TS2_15930 [Bacillus sp. J14TS2]